MTTNYTEEIAMALDMLSEDGTELTHWPKNITSSAGKWHKDFRGGENRSQTINAVYWDIEAERNLAGQRLTRKLLIAASGLTYPIENDDVVQIGSEMWSISNVKTTAPDGTAIIYEAKAGK